MDGGGSIQDNAILNEETTYLNWHSCEIKSLIASIFLTTRPSRVKHATTYVKMKLFI